jgi:hypothetical protein
MNIFNEAIFLFQLQKLKTQSAPASVPAAITNVVSDPPDAMRLPITTTVEANGSQ